MLEIGIDSGASLSMWLKYLSNCFIWGMDINIEKQGERFHIIQGDQSNISDLNKIISTIQPNNLDLIIDDGSHIPEHQILSFIHLFDKLLKNGGIYIIEDIETSYWKRNGLYNYRTNYGINHPMNIINIFTKVLHLINREFISPSDLDSLDIYIDRKIIDSISTITFGQNCIIIKKKEDYEYDFLDRHYRFSQNI
jgi:hypothetical protein